MKPSKNSTGEPPRVGERRVDVQVTYDEDGRRRVLLQDLSYGPGIGWYAQKTVRLDEREVDALMGALCCVRQVIQNNRSPGRRAVSSPAPLSPTGGGAPATASPKPPEAAEILHLDDHLRRDVS